jgi:ribosomal protein L29
VSEQERVNPTEELRQALAGALAEVADLRIQLHSANTAVIQLQERVDALEADLAEARVQLQRAR